jgi:hypothetical protein
MEQKSDTWTPLKKADVVGAKQVELARMESELVSLEAEFKTNYAKEIEQDALLKRKLKENSADRLVRKAIIHNRLYVPDSHTLKPEVEALLETDFGNRSMRLYAVSDVERTLLETDSILKRFEEQANTFYSEIDKLPHDYQTLRNKVEELRSKVYGKRDYVERLMDDAYFRQYAKEQKQYFEKRKQNEADGAARKAAYDALLAYLNKGGVATEHLCSCGAKATHICDCGCLCCGQDPCTFNCGGAVVPLAEGLAKGIKPKKEVKQ